MEEVTRFDDDEAARRYEQVAPRLSSQQYEASAEQALSRLTPAQRAELGQWLAQRSGGEMTMSGMDYQVPRQLVQYTSRVRGEQPDVMGQLLGGLTGGSSAANAGGRNAEQPDRQGRARRDSHDGVSKRDGRPLSRTGP